MSVYNISGNFGTVFVDQSYWQSSVAAKPRQGMWGFLIGGLVWFAIPFSFATTMGLAYVALGTHRGEPLLTASQVGEGQYNIKKALLYTLTGNEVTNVVYSPRNF